VHKHSCSPTHRLPTTVHLLHAARSTDRQPNCDYDLTPTSYDIISNLLRSPPPPPRPHAPRGSQPTAHRLASAQRPTQRPAANGKQKQKQRSMNHQQTPKAKRPPPPGGHTTGARWQACFRLPWWPKRFVGSHHQHGLRTRTAPGTPGAGTRQRACRPHAGRRAPSGFLRLAKC
jgi:hypothetical protein